MFWWSLAGVLLLVVGAVLLAARQGRGWWRFLLAGAAGWTAAQAGKSLFAIPLYAAYAGAAGMTHGALVVAAQWWFPAFAALLAGLWEELGKYLPLRWLRVDRRGAALALGLGVGAMEALIVGLGILQLGLAGAAAGEGAVTALLPVWERFWAIAFHAASATIDGVAVVRRRLRWWVLAVALHTANDLSAGWYQSAAARHASTALPLAVAELGAAAVAVLTWWIGRRAWRSLAGSLAPAPPAGAGGAGVAT